MVILTKLFIKRFIYLLGHNFCGAKGFFPVNKDYNCPTLASLHYSSTPSHSFPALKMNNHVQHYSILAQAYYVLYNHFRLSFTTTNDRWSLELDDDGNEQEIASSQIINDNQRNTIS